MIICSCNVFSEQQVLEAISGTQGMRSPSEVYRCLGCSPQCGRCARTIRSLMNKAQGHDCGACAEECPAAALVGMIAAE